MNKLDNNNYILKHSDYVMIAAEEPLPKAIHAVLSLIDLTKINLKVGITSANSFNDDYRNNIIKLLTEKCLNIIVLWFGSKDEWDNLGWNKIAGNVIIKADGIADLVNIINSNISTSEWRRVKLLNRLYASAIYELIKNFGHNSKSDITNQLLAPIRMLLIENEYDYIKVFINDLKTEKIFNLFESDVCFRIDYNHGYYGLMIREYWIAIYNGLHECNEDNSKEIINNIDKFMILLSECRIQAGENVRHIRSARQPFNYKKDDSKRKILVIDDDIETWLLTLLSLSKRLGKNVQIYVSKDATILSLLDEYPMGKKLNIQQCLSDFDIVLLDIYLKDQKGEDLNGLDFLADIRERIMHLPVILWTTSTEKELPAEAALANGFIFKKTATIESIASTILAWLSIGKSQRLWSLPNPYFDYALRNPSLREVAMAFTKWTLRYMDCFHAIDHFYFKYFNDHGGRHILGVMDIAAKLLRPFIFQMGEDALLSKDPKIRNIQLFCLYIAILCHEYGMFPIYKGECSMESSSSPKPSDWVIIGHKRKLHGVRGMLMLLSESSDIKNIFDINGCDLYIDYLDSIELINTDDQIIKVGKEVRIAIGLLVGYHQRCFNLASENPDKYVIVQDFSRNNGGAREKVYSANTECHGNWTCWDNVSKTTSTAWSEVIENGKIWQFSNLRKMCAILRFADALDVDHTRLPADFLLNEKNRRALQDVEDSKRQVVASVQIDQGIVSFEFYAQPLNNKYLIQTLDFIQRIYNQIDISNLIFIDEKEKNEFIRLKEFVFNDPNMVKTLQNNFNEPWKNVSEQDIRVIFRQKNVREPIENFLRSCLLVYFTSLSYSTDGIESHILDTLATFSAILVILEVEAEYDAINEVNLSHIIQLGFVAWSNERISLSILNRRQL